MRVPSLLVVVCLCILGCANHARVLGTELVAGFSAVDITPPGGFRKGGGYGEVISTGIHDPLFAKAMVLKQGHVATALVVCDLLSIPAKLSTQARRRASDRTGIPAANIIIAATHNHGSPEYWGSLRDIFHDAAVAEHGTDPHEVVYYQKLLVEVCVLSIEKADKACAPTNSEIVVARQAGLAFNRRFHMRDGSVRFNPGRGNPDIIRPAGPVDDDLPFLIFRQNDEAATPLGSLTVFAMHTAVFGGTEFGADFPGHLQTALRKRFGPKFLSVFAEGTAGDVNHIDVAGHRKRQVPDESMWIGNTLAQTIESHLGIARPISSPILAVRGATVLAPFTPGTEVRYDQAKSLLMNQETVRAPFLTLVEAWRDCHRFRHTREYGGKKPLEVQVIRLNADTAIVSLPHEIFVETGITIKAASPFRHTIVISLANGVDYYIPTRRAFEEGSYEVSTCPLEPGCAELLSTTAIKLLGQLKPATQEIR